MVQWAVVETQPLQRQEAEVDIDWATTGIYFLKEVHLLVPLVRPLALHPPPTAVTETAATKGIDAGMMLFFLINFFTVHINYFILKCLVSLCSVILAHSQTAVSQVISDLSCHDGEEHVVVVMTGIEDVEVEREDVEEEEKPTEEDGKLLDYVEPYFCHWSLVLRESQNEGKCLCLSLACE